MNRYSSAIQCFKSIYKTNQCGFTGSGESDDSVNVSLFYMDAYILQGMYLTVFSGKGFVCVFYFYHTHHSIYVYFSYLRFDMRMILLLPYLVNRFCMFCMFSTNSAAILNYFYSFFYSFT